jgi:hypothetical protein
MALSEKQQQIADESLSRAQCGLSTSNYPTIYREFLDKGIAMHDIKPRENILTYNAWRAKGRQVKKGEHGVKITTYIDAAKTEKDETSGETKTRSFRRPWTTVVFHISQTDQLKLN